jgi:3-deoxy-manno-octulosonate cytidylyltransferase (CMP-KDO synthetase)
VPRPQSSTAEREVGSRPQLGAVGIIPARLQSTRLPNKPLQDLGGAPLIVRVLERVRASSALRDVWVATDSEEVVRVVEGVGGQALLTSADHRSGLDRVAEAARQLSDGRDPDPDSVFVNIQGDEPFVSPEGLDHLVRLMEHPDVEMASIAAPFLDRDEVEDPNRVKVVIDRELRALYFSRAPIPSGYGPAAIPLLHIGVYAYRLRTLFELASLPPAPLEMAERLEQLRALWNGIQIHIAVGEYQSTGIDTPEDLARARDQWAKGRTRA